MVVSEPGAGPVARAGNEGGLNVDLAALADSLRKQGGTFTERSGLYTVRQQVSEARAAEVLAHVRRDRLVLAENHPPHQRAVLGTQAHHERALGSLAHPVDDAGEAAPVAAGRVHARERELRRDAAAAQVGAPVEGGPRRRAPWPHPSRDHHLAARTGGWGPAHRSRRMGEQPGSRPSRLDLDDRRGAEGPRARVLEQDRATLDLRTHQPAHRDGLDGAQPCLTGE